MRWWMTRRVERQATRMHEVMERLDVDAAALARVRQGQAYADARARCLTCGTSDRCLRWLDSRPARASRRSFVRTCACLKSTERPRPASKRGVCEPASIARRRRMRLAAHPPPVLILATD